MLYYEKLLNPNTYEWMLLIHGLGGSMKTWKYQTEKFSMDYNLLMVDLDGHGKSADKKLSSLYKPTSTVRSIRQILAYEKIDRVHIVSLSLGTLIALEFARMYPEMVESLVLGGGIVNLTISRQFILKAAEFMTKHFPAGFSYKVFAHIIMPKKHHETSRNIFIREARKLNAPMFNKWVTSIGMANRRMKRTLKTIRKKRIPTLFISGKEDYMFLNGIKDLCRRAKSFQFNILRNCGHVVSIEKSELFNRLTLRFLMRQRRYIPLPVLNTDIHSNPDGTDHIPGTAE